MSQTSVLNLIKYIFISYWLAYTGTTKVCCCRQLHLSSFWDAYLISISLNKQKVMNEVGLLLFLVAAQTDGESLTKERCVGITGVQASVLLETFCSDKCIESELWTLTFRVCVTCWINIVLHRLFKFTETRQKGLTSYRFFTWEDWYNSHLYLCKTTASSWLA